MFHDIHDTIQQWIDSMNQLKFKHIAAERGSHLGGGHLSDLRLQVLRLQVLLHGPAAWHAIHRAHAQSYRLLNGLCPGAHGHGLPGGVTGPGEAALIHAGSIEQTEIPEAPLEVLVQEGVEHGVEAAVGVAQGDAEVPHGHHQRVILVDGHHGLDDDEDVDGRPADDEGCHHHQHHAGDAPQVAVLLLGAGEQADALQTHDHQAIASSYHQHWHHKGEDKHRDLGHSVPVPLWLGEPQGAHGPA